jgi:YD repeat-containing protein
MSLPGETGQTVITTIAGMGRNFQFSYAPVSYTPKGYIRNFLLGFSDLGCSSPINYKFAYNGVTLSGSSYSTTLPDSSSTLTDYWGYYSATATGGTLVPSVYINGNPFIAAYMRYLIKVSGSPGSAYSYSLLNNNRAADTTNVKAGSLTNITYAQGGSTSITYESNDYFDIPSNSVVTGGGIRVKQITDADNITSTNIVRHYAYLNPGGVSSGRPISLPQFAFTIPYSGAATGQSLWTACTTLSAYDLSDEDHTIMYANVKVSQTNAGSTVYNYNIPAYFWDLQANPSCSGCTVAEWYPTNNDVGRYTCSSSYGPVLVNNIYSYPFIPNPNYDFERGLPTSVVAYNDAGTEVSETDYTYQRSYTPTQITAFKSDDNPNGSLKTKGYNKYFVYYNTSELAFTVTKKVFDSNTLSVAQSSSVSYTYGSANHKLLTRQQATNSDGSMLTTYMSYVKDYTTANANSNANINALYYMQQQNINAPVETYQQLTPPGGTAVTTGASLTLYSGQPAASGINYLPAEQFKLVQANGVSNFTPFAINPSTPSVTPDSRYFPVSRYDLFDGAGFPVTIDDTYKNEKTIITEHSFNNVIAAFNNAAFAEVAVNDFDSNFPTGTLSPSFSITGTGSANLTGHTGAGYNFGTTQSLTKTAARNPAAQYDILSLWVKAAAGSNTINVSLNGGAAAAYPYTGTGAFQYVEFKLPVSTLSGNFTVTVTSLQNVVIDDVLLYPDVAEASTTAYDPNTHFKTSQTNTNGVSAYYTYDQWGRLLYQFDQDKNIVLRKSYILSQNVQDIVSPVISYNPGSGINTLTPVVFSTNGTLDVCTAAGLVYNWAFGDGTSMQTTNAVAPAHTYAAPGMYNVILTVTSPYFAQKTATATVVVSQAVTTISYSNTAIAGTSVSGVTFTNGSNTYNFTSSTLNGATIVPGTYTVTITTTGTGYSHLEVYDPTDLSDGQCLGVAASYHITITVTGNHTLNVVITASGSCGLIGA